MELKHKIELLHRGLENITKRKNETISKVD
jgi:hypothetical protein